MSKTRDLADFVSAGNPLADGTIDVADINGVTATAAEINILDGVTATTAELNYTDGVTSNLQTQLDAKLPLSGGTMTGDVTFVNITTSGYLRGPASFTIDPAAHGDDTGTVIIAGNLQVDGTTTTINSTSVAVDDLNLTLASGALNAGAANGAGLTVDGANATLTYVSTTDNWALNKSLDVTGNITVSGTVDGRDVAADGTKLDGIESGATADQTGAEIKALYEAELDTNAFTDAEKTKLAGIESGADVTDTTNVTAAGALMDSELTNITAVKALNQGVATTDSPTFVTLNATTVDLGNWTITEDGSGNLLFATSGTNKMKLDSSGNLTCVGDITAFGTI